jgi:hypothetical protein
MESILNQKKFRVEVEELIILQEALFNALCDVMKKEKKDEGVNSKE